MTGRLILWLGAALTVFWLVAAGLGVIVMRDEFDEVFDSALQETAERLAPLIRAGLAKPPSARGEVTEAAGEEYLTYQVRDGQGRVLMQSHDLGDQPFSAPLRHGFWNADGRRYYTVVVDDIYVQVADSLAHRWEATEEGGMTLVLPLLLLLPVSIFGVWGVVRRAVAPVDELRREIATKDGGNLAALDLEPLPVELRPIGTSVNLLLSRLRSALEAEREFTANSAHELRTPLAGALAQTQLLLRELGDTGPKERARQVERALTRLVELTEKLLQMARADAGIGVAEGETDLAALLDLIVLDFTRQSGEPGRIAYSRPAKLEVRRSVDPDAFAIVIRNLVENALLHGDPAKPVEIDIDASGAVTIVNGAPVLDSESLTEIRRRFVRRDQNRPGSGLGLSIVDRLLGQMGANLTLLSPAEGRQDGFEARIDWMTKHASLTFP